MNPPDLPPPLPNPVAPVVSAGQPPRPSPLSLKLLGRINVSLLLAGLNTWMLSFADPDEGTLLSGFIIFLVAATLGVVLLLHRFWQKVDDGTLRYSPAIYAWLNLVPVLNLYWQFVSFVGLSKALIYPRKIKKSKITVNGLTKEALAKNTNGLSSSARQSGKAKPMTPTTPRAMAIPTETLR